MSFDQDIADIRARIAKAEAEQGSWRTAGNQEKYLENYSLVGALEIELDLLRKQRVQAAGNAERFRRVDPPPAVRAREAPHDAAERERLMAEYSITVSGRGFQYSKYRYDRFEDALNYARKQRLKPTDVDGGSPPPAQVVEAPDEMERRRMARYGITFEDGVYHLGQYRYDRLADAMRYARLPEGKRLPISRVFRA